MSLCNTWKTRSTRSASQNSQRGTILPKYNIQYAFDCSCYGRVEIEADSPEHAQAIARDLHSKDALIDGWDPNPEVGTENHRVVSILDESENEVVSYFDLEDAVAETQSEG